MKGGSLMKKIILSLMCGILMLGVATGCGSNATGRDDSKANNITVNAPEELEVKTYISNGERQLIVSVTNKNSETIGSGYMDISYYDENNNKVSIWGSTNQRFNMLEKGNEVVFGFDLPGEDTSKFYVPAKTEVKITIDEEYKESFAKQISEYKENFSYSYSVEDSTITLKITNNSSKSEFIPRSVSVVFYKNNKPVYVEDVMLSGTLNAGQSKTATTIVPNDYKKKQETGKTVLLDYDSIKLFRVVEGNS